ncbi:MAG: hypothetical protein H8E26_04670 [FCB group bacterium]|nr:hypothetical protein [FCB group bacterium]MBL7028325.1 hypothetical protein [Candidatus Neomarinimicrobiota bacterium]MBL7121644.1 hypothetical protein [Candidatus Neomarinimicrobiota bacterium]
MGMAILFGSAMFSLPIGILFGLRPKKWRRPLYVIHAITFGIALVLSFVGGNGSSGGSISDESVIGLLLGFGAVISIITMFGTMALKAFVVEIFKSFKGTKGVE